MSYPPDEPISELLRGLKSPLPAFRAKAARALGKYGPTGTDVYQQLLALTNDPEQVVREAAVQGLAGFGVQGVPTLIRLLTSQCKYVRRNAVWGLGKLGPEALPALVALIPVLKDPDPRTATGAAQTLGGMGQAAEAAVPALAEAMRGTNVVLCRMAAKALSQIGRPALPTLVSHLKHHDPFVRGEAAVALGWMGPVASAAVPHLIHLLSTAAGSGRYRKLSQPAWADSSNTITPVATPPPSSGEQSVLLQVIQALGRIGPSAQEAMEQLDELADDTRDDVRSAVMSAMRSIRGEDSLADDE
ncbi:MAG: HEAT repeat domain-containing protein [Fimbriiglobus sp.]|nr:HEAT repeat domain-containing protein [Fimbriiglobus sp.]